jgi:hypothetical protein
MKSVSERYGQMLHFVIDHHLKRHIRVLRTSDIDIGAAYVQARLNIVTSQCFQKDRTVVSIPYADSEITVVTCVG